MLHYTLSNLQNEYIYIFNVFTTLFKNMKKVNNFYTSLNCGKQILYVSSNTRYMGGMFLFSLYFTQKELTAIQQLKPNLK